MFISYTVTVISTGTYQYASQIFIFHSFVMFLVRSALSLMTMKEACAEAVKCDKSALIWVGGLSLWLFVSQSNSFALDISSQSAAKTKGGPWFPISSWEACGSCFSVSILDRPASLLLLQFLEKPIIWEVVKKQNTFFAVFAQILFSCWKIDQLSPSKASRLFHSSPYADVPLLSLV